MMVQLAVPPSDGTRRLLTHGLAWNALYQIFSIVLGLATTMVLARIISPEDYGRAAAVNGVLTIVATFGATNFIAQSLQVSDAVEPDWSLHWSVGLCIQAASFLVCQALAGCLWVFPRYRSIAPLLHVAAVGNLFECPNRIGGTMLRRAMDFRRLRIVHGCGGIAAAAIMLALAVHGAGAFALVVGWNLVPSLPFAIYLLLIRRWKPRGGWWTWPRLAAYRAPLRFGLQQSGSSLLRTGREVIEFGILPVTLGFGSLGLLNRARALFATTVGRAVNVMNETAYPLLPRLSAQSMRYARTARLFVQAMCLVLIPGAGFLALHGQAVSRLLYGWKWIGADSLILPCVVVGATEALVFTMYLVLLAANRLRRCFVLDMLLAGLAAPSLIVAVLGAKATVYAWTTLLGPAAAACLAIVFVSDLLFQGWVRAALVPAMTGTVTAAALTWAVRQMLELDVAAGIEFTAPLYVIALFATLRWLFPSSLAALLECLPVGDSALRMFRLAQEAPR
jgi:O-antigen/teichoic acid export membrane protein